MDFQKPFFQNALRSVPEAWRLEGEDWLAAAGADVLLGIYHDDF